MNRAASSRLLSSLEVLETRIAPAAIIFNYTDADGNPVTITSSKGTLADLQAALSPTPIDATTPTQILSLNLGAVFKGADITVEAAGDAVTKIGFINAAGMDLGKVSIDGELNRIVAGDINSRTPGLRGLTLNTFGKFDVTPATVTDGEFDSEVIGAVNFLTINGDMEGASLKVFGAGFGPDSEPTFRDGKIGNIFIGGSLIGTARNFGGSIVTAGDIGNIVINGDVKGFLDGSGVAVTGQDHNAYISAGLKLGSVNVVGNIEGGDGFESGHITSGFGIRSLNAKNIVGGEGKDSGVVGSGGAVGKINIVESVKGGFGKGSGAVLSFLNMQSVTIGGDVRGGDGEGSGWVASGGTLAAVNIGRDLMGGEGPQSGQVFARGKISSVTIGRDLVGGTDFETGFIGSLLGLGPVLIKGDILAGSGERSALIATQKASYGEGDKFIAAPIASVTVLGSIDCGDGSDEERAVGGPAGNFSAGIFASGNLGSVLIKGDVLGGDGFSSGRIASTNDIKSVTIEGTLRGGDGSSSGTITASGALGSVFIEDNLEGGDGSFSGAIFSATKITKVTIGGDVFGGFGSFSGTIEASNESNNESTAGPGLKVGGVIKPAEIGSISIGGSLVGGDSGSRSGSIYANGKISSISIGDGVGTGSDESENANGSVIGGFATNSGSITSLGDLGSVKIKSDLRGGTGNNSGRIYSGGKINSLAVGVETGGSIRGGFGDQISGYDPGQVYANDAISKVLVGGTIDGAEGDFTGQIRGRSIGSVVTGAIEGGRGHGSGSLVAYSLGIGSVKIIGNSSRELTGALVAGGGVHSGWIAAEGSIGSVEAQFIGGSGNSRARISAVDSIGSVTVNGNIEFSDIFAGYDTDGNPVNPDAQIGTVRTIGSPGIEGNIVSGNLIGVNIVAGAITGRGGPTGQGDRYFGTQDDEPIAGYLETSKFSRIASVIIGGRVLPVFADQSVPPHFGIIAQNVSSIVVGGTALKLKAGAGNDGLLPSNLVGADMTYGEVTTSVIVND